VLERANDVDAAIRAYDRAIAADTSRAQGYEGRASLFARVGRTEDAARDRVAGERRHQPQTATPSSSKCRSGSR